MLHSLQAAKEQPDNIPFELRILEVLLFESMTYLEDRARRIKFVSKGVETDITLNVNHADIRRLLPLQTAVTALEYDVRGMKVAVSEVRWPGHAHPVNMHACRCTTLYSIRGRHTDKCTCVEKHNFDPEYLAAPQMCLTLPTGASKCCCTCPHRGRERLGC